MLFLLKFTFWVKRVGLLTEQKMLDLSRLLPGTYSSLLLADLGMEVRS
jgi:crotonobetainyl-CoA:carnitine CoA-transferase CaiB-like acyl-CoA transferase